jgi:hypothetical protein
MSCGGVLWADLCWGIPHHALVTIKGAVVTMLGWDPVSSASLPRVALPVLWLVTRFRDAIPRHASVREGKKLPCPWCVGHLAPDGHVVLCGAQS